MGSEVLVGPFRFDLADDTGGVADYDGERWYRLQDKKKSGLIGSRRLRLPVWVLAEKGERGYGEERANLGDHASCTHRHAPSDRDVRQDGHVPTEPAVVPDRDRPTAFGASSAVPDCRVEWMRARKTVGGVRKEARPI